MERRRVKCWTLLSKGRERVFFDGSRARNVFALSDFINCQDIRLNHIFIRTLLRIHCKYENKKKLYSIAILKVELSLIQHFNARSFSISLCITLSFFFLTSFIIGLNID